jgi:amino acid transporter
MFSFLPIPGGHIKLAERFVDPSLSFSMGWNYWSLLRSTIIFCRLNNLSRYNWTVVLPAELSAAAVLIGFWDKNQSINPAAWIAVTMTIVIIINFLGAGGLICCVTC